MKNLVGLSLLALSVMGLPPAQAQTDWPTRPITITVGFAPGGTVDVVARAVGETLSKHLGKPVVIESRPGGGGAVAATALMQTKPDGYNLVATGSPTVTFDPQVSSLAFSLNDFTYVAAVAQFPEALIAKPSKGWTSLKEAIHPRDQTGGLPSGLARH